jgi:hypothetical protein
LLFLRTTFSSYIALLFFDIPSPTFCSTSAVGKSVDPNTHKNINTLITMHFNSITPIILSFALLSNALPRFPPTNFDHDLDEEFVVHPPSAPTQTPLHTTALMAGVAMQTPTAPATPLHTTVLLAAAALPTIHTDRPVNAELR